MSRLPGFALVFAFTIFALPATAHEMFLRSGTHFLAEESDAVITLVNGTFDKSENAIERSRMADVSVIAHGEIKHPDHDQWFDADKTSYLNIKLGKAGTYVVGVSTKESIIELSDADFNDYLVHDRVDDVLAARKQENINGGSVRERYSKHVRTLIQVGDARTGDFGATLGYPVEILARRNPYEMAIGDRFEFEVQVNGAPVANQLVRASYEGFHGHDDAGGHINANSLRTDANGIAGFVIDRPGKWYVTLIHMVRVDDEAADYESNWATLTFEIK